MGNLRAELLILLKFFIILAAAAGPAAAQNGLVVNAPPGHQVVKEAPRSEWSEGFSVASIIDKQAACLVGFASIGATNATQLQLNTFFATPAYVASVQKIYAQRYGNTKISPYMQDGMQGVQLVFTANGNATLVTILNTPRGRTNVACVGPEAKFDVLRPEFEAITRGVVPPR